MPKEEQVRKYDVNKFKPKSYCPFGQTFDISLIKVNSTSVRAWSLIRLCLKDMLLLDFEFCMPA